MLRLMTIEVNEPKLLWSQKYVVNTLISKQSEMLQSIKVVKKVRCSEKSILKMWGMCPPLQNLWGLLHHWVYCSFSDQLGFTAVWFGSGFKNNLKDNSVSFVQHTTEWVHWPAVTHIETCSSLWLHYAEGMQRVPGPELRCVVAPRSLKWGRVALCREGKW